ncbi:MAG TPA: XRE family transcriptional regulator [Bryobacteraceae bacterium]|nr:XRE family transcriptional regulator [Bryobacteraceae bacterium]
MSSNFNPEMLILARESRGLPQSELAAAAGVQQGTISKVESGVMIPSPELEERFATSLDYPVALFRQTDRVYGFNSSVFFHRKRQSLPDRTLRKLHAYMNLTRMQVARLLRSIDISTPCRFQRIEPEEYGGRVEVVAQLVRSTWRIPPGPVRNMIAAIEDAGGVVVSMDFETRQADAISEWAEPSPPIFLINSNSEITGDRLRLTLAHEVAHVVMHRFPNPKMEAQANTFAAEFLMPRKEIKASLYGLSFAKLMDLKSQWKVSMAALVQRAFELGTITDAQRRYLFIQFGRRGYRLREPAETDIPLERPELFNELIETHLRDLGYAPGELAPSVMLLREDEFRSRHLEKNRLRLVG